MGDTFLMAILRSSEELAPLTDEQLEIGTGK